MSYSARIFTPTVTNTCWTINNGILSVMRRACKVTLKFATTKKRQAIGALLSRYRAAVNFFIQSLWVTAGSLNNNTLSRLSATWLSVSYKAAALKQALDIVNATKRAARARCKVATCPRFYGAAVLPSKFVVVENGRGSFDLVIKLSSLVLRKRITIPTRHTAVTRKWLARGTFIQGCALSENGIVLWVDVPDEAPKCGLSLGVDVGMNKLLSDSDGNHYGQQFQRILGKIRRSKPESKARYRHYAERENYINRVVNLLPWAALAVLGVEDLSDLKRGKQRNRGKQFRKALAPWTYRRVLDRIGHKAQENRVRLVAVPPAYTSQTCPACGTVARENRRGEDFHCIVCHHTGDADTVGAVNILARTLETVGSVMSPMQLRSIR